MKSMIQKFLVLFTLVGTILNSGPRLFASPPNPLALFTDVMDDDISAIIHMLIDPMTKKRLKVIVVSTGNTNVKAELVRLMLKVFGARHIKVIAGTSTDLSQNEVTAFADAPDWGKEVLGERRFKALSRLNAPEPEFIQAQIEEALGESTLPLDVALLTGPIDLNHLMKNESRSYADLYAMGLYKIAHDKILAPYNVQTGLEATHQFMNDRIRKFKRIFHVPSNVAQSATGTEGGYLADQKLKDRYEEIVRTAGPESAVFKLLVDLRSTYKAKFRDYSARVFGAPSNVPNWLLESLGRTGAGNFYLSDLFVAYLAGMPEDQLIRLVYDQRRMSSTFADGKFQWKFDTENGVFFHDLRDVDGLAVFNEHLRAISDRESGINLYQPRGGTFPKNSRERREVENPNKPPKRVIK